MKGVQYKREKTINEGQCQVSEVVMMKWNSVLNL